MDIKINIVKKKDIDLLIDFQKEIIDEMSNKEWFAPLTKEEFLTPIEGRDNVYFFTLNDEIIGLLVLACDIKEVLKEYKLQSDNYMLIDSIMVKSKYRGKGIQRKMLEFAYDRAKELNMDGLVATVHPDNIYSLNNFIKEKYEILHALNIHGGVRNVMIKNII